MNNEPAADRIYKNDGNAPLIALLERNSLEVLDIGCGSGDNAALLRARDAGCLVDGITHSQSEARLASRHMRDCWVFDIEEPIPDALQSRSYDALIFSHVLEHLREPAKTVADYTRLLRPEGMVLIAVPNILSWRMRAKFLAGDFTYADTGLLDVTHVRFFTYHTAAPFLLAASPHLVLQSSAGHGSFPLWWFRRYLLPKPVCSWIDSWACRNWPNLFGDQILLKAIKR